MKGHWVEFDRHWRDTDVVNCQVCGRLIPSRAWMFDGGRGELRSCSPDCGEIYFSYVEPEHGPKEAAE